MNKGKQEKSSKKKVVVQRQITMGDLTKAMKGLSSKPVSAMSGPAVMGSSLKPYRRVSLNKRGVLVLEALDLVAVIAAPGTNTTSGQQLLSLPISPLAKPFLNTSLYYEALRHEKYLFKKLRAIWEPDVATSANAGFIMAYDPDISDAGPIVKPTTADAQLQVQQVYMGYRDSIKSSLWMPTILDIRVKEDPQDFYYTNYLGGDPRLASQGQLFFAVTGSPINANTILGTVALEYKVEFFDPSVDQINSEMKVSGTGLTSVTTSNSGLNKLKNQTFVLSGTANEFPFGVDAQGNSFINIPPGIHEIVRVQTNTGNNTAMGLPTYSLVDNILSAIPGVLTVLESVAGTQTAIDSSTGYVRTKIQAPLGGSKLYSTDTLAGTISDTLRLVSWAASALI